MPRVVMLSLRNDMACLGSSLKTWPSVAGRYACQRAARNRDALAPLAVWG
jgi:hypothetical protein